ncbi:hypothetical protein B0H21DRAFT_106488 [Amylocystis lapponica]|nr:hypothetical protein B0H21DRAFT_106488 [Amylocystis lapponica]
MRFPFLCLNADDLLILLILLVQPAPAQSISTFAYSLRLLHMHRRGLYFLVMMVPSTWTRHRYPLRVLVLSLRTDDCQFATTKLRWLLLFLE